METVDIPATTLPEWRGRKPSFGEILLALLGRNFVAIDLCVKAAAKDSSIVATFTLILEARNAHQVVIEPEFFGKSVAEASASQNLKPILEKFLPIAA